MAKVTVKIPKLGLTMTSARLVEWSCAVGDRVDAGQVIGALEIDKASYEVAAPAAGRVAQLLVEADPDAEHDIGEPIAVIETSAAEG